MDYKYAIERVLKVDDRLWFENEQKETELNQTLLIDLAENYDEKVLSLLFGDEKLKEKFFACVGKTHVFKQTDFRFFLEETKLDNSYTQYKNRIGLSDGKRFLKDTSDVVLNFPYKDCVLEGGQSTEEGTDNHFEYDEKVTKPEEKKGYKAHQYNKKRAKRKEVFFNEVLAAEEIDRLFDEKALVNWKRFSKDGEIPLLRGGIAKGNDGVENKQHEVESVASWQTKSLFPFWQLPKNKHLTQRAKELRQQGILSEVIFWKHFKDKAKLKGFDIDRQVIIGNFIVDFFIAELGFIIEIDGSSHKGKVGYDKEREHYLKSLGLKIIRYTDSEVKNNIDGIYQHLLQSIHERKTFLSTPSNSANLPPLNEGNYHPFKRDVNGTIKENLIIKGNNLLALHSLKNQFSKKIKLIYIDPPYNTGNDGFKYNDKFNHSTWLTFMKNRLEAARELLRDDGAIFVQCDDNEQAYLKVLMDEVFGRENFIEQILWKKRGGAPNDKIIGAIHEYIIVYAKNNLVRFFRRQRSREQIARYKNPDNHKKGAWAVDNLMANVKGGRFVKSLYFPIENPVTGEKHYPSSNGNWRFNKETIQKLLENDEIYFGQNGKGRPKLKRFLCDVKDGIPFHTWWDFVSQGSIGTLEVLKLFGSVNKFDTTKPEDLVKELMELSTQPDDIVLDYHLGSGTTAAVAHKMGRQYIGIEQMDYIENITVERLKKVIAGEQGGISKAVNWQGGGSFLYCELAKWNEAAKEKINACENLDELKEFFSEMVEKYFLNYNLKIKAFQEKVVHEEEFKNLSLDEQKQMFAAMLDNNQMYVCRSEMEDKKFGIGEKDKELTREFYKN